MTLYPLGVITSYSIHYTKLYDNLNFEVASEKYTEIAKVMGLDVDGLGPEVVKENLLNRLKVLRKKLGINDYAIVESYNFV